MSWFNKSAKHPLEFTPEWQEYMKLIKVLMHSDVPPEAAEEATRGMPLLTVEDIGARQAKLWNLAVEVYKIPEDFLSQKMWGKKRENYR